MQNKLKVKGEGIMKAQKISSKKGADTLVVGTAAGVIVSCLITLLLAGITAILIINGKIPESIMPYLSIATVFIANYLGVFVAGRSVSEKKLITCIVCGSIYFFILLAAKILVFEGEFDHGITTVISIILGIGLAVLTVTKPKKQQTGKKFRKLHI